VVDLFLVIFSTNGELSGGSLALIKRIFHRANGYFSNSNKPQRILQQAEDPKGF
jgi:hypothetical protein